MHARIELLDVRRLFSGSPHGGRVDGDATLEGTVDFDDLVSLAQNYTTSKTWSAGDFSYDGVVNFSDLIVLAQNYNSGAGSAAESNLAQIAEYNMPASATLNRKGKLVIVMGSYDNAVVTSSGRSTHVLLTHVSRHGEVWSANVIDQTFMNVRSIDIASSTFDDAITLGDGLRFTVVHSGDGADTIKGGAGDSALYGGSGDDVINAGAGSDSIYGEAGEDRLFGEGGDDLVDGGLGKDRLDGGSGRNRLLGGSGSDMLTVRKKDRVAHDARDRLKELA